MHYGTLTAEVQSASVGGAVTAFILMGDGGDEIDFEWVGGKYTMSKERERSFILLDLVL